MFWMNGKAPDNAPATKSVSHVEQRKVRYQERKSLITKTADSGNPAVRAANQRLSLNNDNILRAEAADYVYKVDEYNRGHIKVLPEAPVGLQLQDPTQIPGLENATFTDKKTGFGAALFKSEINNETMLTFRGTNNALTFKEDWGTNIAQGAGIENDQYNQAMRLAKQSKRSLEKNSFSIVGHSLGGGLASASTAITGASGYTFNSAGLHPKTAPRQGGMNNEKASKLITSQWVKGDVLTSVQNYLNPALTGILTGVGASHGGGLGAVVGMLVSKLIPKIPSALGAMNKLESVNGGSPMDRHSMSEVIAGIEAQKKSDIKTLEKVNAS